MKVLTACEAVDGAVGDAPKADSKGKAVTWRSVLSQALRDVKSLVLPEQTHEKYTEIAKNPTESAALRNLKRKAVNSALRPVEKSVSGWEDQQLSKRERKLLEEKKKQQARLERAYARSKETRALGVVAAAKAANSNINK